MSHSQQLIPFAFGAVIVLLAANLLAGTRRPAEAGVASGPTVPYVVQISAINVLDTSDRIYRFWSDGTVDVNFVQHQNPGQLPPTVIWWGVVPLETGQRADLNLDGCIDSFDLNILLADWCSAFGGNPCGTCGT